MISAQFSLSCLANARLVGSINNWRTFNCNWKSPTVCVWLWFHCKRTCIKHTEHWTRYKFMKIDFWILNIIFLCNSRIDRKCFMWYSWQNVELIIIYHRHKKMDGSCFLLSSQPLVIAHLFITLKKKYYAIRKTKSCIIHSTTIWITRRWTSVNGCSFNDHGDVTNIYCEKMKSNQRIRNVQMVLIVITSSFFLSWRNIRSTFNSLFCYSAECNTRFRTF